MQSKGYQEVNMCTLIMIRTCLKGIVQLTVENAGKLITDPGWFITYISKYVLQ